MPKHRIARQHVAIVGAGFTGSMLAAHLLRRSDRPTTVTLIERAPTPGTGLAYSTPNSGHVLNVRAYNMSAFPDDPRHFLRWLWAHDSDLPMPPSGHAFVSRACYGAYIRDVLAEAQAAAPPQVTLKHVQGEVVDTAGTGDGISLRLSNGLIVTADVAALCVGHFPPSPPAVAPTDLVASHRFIGDPWDQQAVAAIGRDDTVLILGTGLTMVDTVLSLEEQGHRGRIVAVSRRGLLPNRHEEVRPYKSFVCPEVMPRTVLDVLIALKADVRRAQDQGYDWRSAFDALRPHHHRIWKHLPLEERRRFLRHARPFWEVHRHRMAPEVADRIAAALASGRLSVRAGRIRSLALTGDGVEVAVQPRRSGDGRWVMTVGAMINAAGPECDYERVRHPLVRSLLDRGLARPDELRLGLDVTEEGAVIDAAGRASERLFAFGPVAKAPFWEMTAVPELRSQCAAAAERLAARSALAPGASLTGVAGTGVGGTPGAPHVQGPA
ncbi:hypothetical protein DEW08_14675 [Azospirillum thermophilum]|uniref:FAD-dependent urate hydroxylase HpyO/Asp monooxygenase CreE-like FAD/NAD(P)-binding domain-containing protein n=2 Tax=Azospirillum thermophilum TaxID=2202148 RepID=A0A2S2CS35_9PROT|nr:hypothetical protein DEW08_14675 [Azospirillum thermophilum]